MSAKESGNKFFRQGGSANAQLAMRQYSVALRLCPSAAKRERAILFCNQGACLQELVRSLHLVPRSTYMGTYHTNRQPGTDDQSIHHQLQNAFDASLKMLHSAIAEDPTYVKANLRKAQVLAAMNRKEEAIAGA